MLVCGSRTWSDYQAVFNRLARLPEGTTIVHGGASGADALAGNAARALGFTEHVFPADWNTYGKSAGYRRNQQMIDSGVDLVIAFHRGKSRGTQHTIDLAVRYVLPLEVHEWPESR